MPAKNTQVLYRKLGQSYNFSGGDRVSKGLYINEKDLLEAFDKAEEKLKVLLKKNVRCTIPRDKIVEKLQNQKVWTLLWIIDEFS